MKFKLMTESVRSNRRRLATSAPVAAETFEQRAMMTTPVILTPAAGSVQPTAQPTITWTPVENAVSYDIWFTDVESRGVILTDSDIIGTSYTPSVDLNQGDIRVWVRANLSGGPAPDWSSPQVFRIHTIPQLTGPVNSALPGSPQKIDSHTPAITWQSAPGNQSFELWFTDRTTGEYERYVIPNLTPVLDSNGNPVLDSEGNVLRQEVRSFELPEALPMGRYQAWIRSTDDAGRVSRWSSVLNFEVAPQVDIIRPTTVTLIDQPTLTWTPVDGATHYEIWVDGEGRQALYRERSLTSTSYTLPRPIGNGTYTFWVRAIFRTATMGEVTGIWSDGATFSRATRPTVTAPIGTDGVVPGIPTVTDLRPTFEWTRIDGAARYEIWIDRGYGPAGWLQTTSSINSYTMTTDLAAGRYTFWVRAVGPRGVATPWSAGYEFQATGGAPVILAPADNSTVGSQPEILWAPVAGAASYEIWIAHVGVDFDFYQRADLPTESHTVEVPLPGGTFRIWVRAIMSDGTAQRWSTASIITVAEQSSSETPEVLLTGLLSGAASLENETDAVQAEAAPAAAQDQEFAAGVVVVQREHTAGDEKSAKIAGDETVPMDSMTSENLIQQLAEGCVQAEWWAVENQKSA